MSDDSVKSHLRAALNQIVAAERTRLHEHYDARNDEYRCRATMLQPLFELLQDLKEEVADIETIDISVTPAGHAASVRIQSASTTRRMSVSTNLGRIAMLGLPAEPANTHFILEEFQSFSWEDRSSETSKRFDTADEVLAYIVDAVGKEVAQRQVLAERVAKKDAGPF